MDAKTNSLNWFEIPAKDIIQATKFYGAIFRIRMEVTEMKGMKMAFFPYADGNGKASGGLVQSKMHKPSPTAGPMIHLNADADLKTVLARVAKACGKVTMPRTFIGDGVGHMAFFVDTEGDRMALHSNK